MNKRHKEMLSVSRGYIRGGYWEWGFYLRIISPSSTNYHFYKIRGGFLSFCPFITVDLTT